ncbi:lipoprotein LpqH [Mycolicibacterium mucogenicum]|uniref:lipoprotein LpqH n=1 Tax=Mycolicibacterium mucogenicum TaxID=56689 RepID=UPI0039772D44
MNINRALAAGIGLLAVGATLIGCSSDKEAGPKASGPGSVTGGGGNTVVKVEGQDLAGLDLKSVTCVKQGGSINIASAPIGGGAQGLGVVMTDASPPKVQSLGLVVDGNALAVSEMGGVKTGSADVKVDGSTYTITGQAAGADMKNPMAGMISKNFEIKVSCG